MFLYGWGKHTVRLAVTFCMNFSSYLLPSVVIDLIVFIILVLSTVHALTLLNQSNLLIHDKHNLKLYMFLAIDIHAKVYLHKYMNYKSTPTCFGYLLALLQSGAN